MLDDDLELVECGDRTRLCVRDDEDEDDDDESAGPAVIHVVHSREKLNWIDRVLGVRDVSTDMDDPDECP